MLMLRYDSRVSEGLQGVGTAATYIGTLLYMMRGVSEAGLPDKEQTRGMVSSLWVMADSVGGYLGDTLGSLAYDNLGFQAGTVVMFSVMLGSVITCSLHLLAQMRSQRAREENKPLLQP